MAGETVLTIVATVLMSGALAAVVTFRLNARRDDRLIRQERLEQLYEAFFEVTRLLYGEWVPSRAAMRGEITHSQALDLVLELYDREGPVSVPVARMEMLAVIYHPKLLPYVDALTDLHAEAHDLIEEYGQHGCNKSEALRMTETIFARLTDVENEFASAVRAQTRIS